MKQRMIKPRIRLAWYQADPFNKVWACDGGGLIRTGKNPFDAYRRWEFSVTDKSSQIPFSQLNF